MNNTTQRSNILLAILGLGTTPEIIEAINAQVLESIFEKFGNLQKIIIFLKENIVKAFLEYSTPEEADFAKNFVHNCEFNNFGKVRIFFSAMQKLEASTRFVECKHFQKAKPLPVEMTVSRVKKEISEHRASQKTKTASSKKQPSQDTLGLSLLPDFNNKENIVTNLLNETKASEEDKTQTHSEITAEIQKPLKIDSKVILISNLDDFFFNVSEIFNLFSCFGNIVKVLLMKNLKKALIEYKKPESCQAAIDNLNNRLFGKSKIKITFSKYKKVDLKRNNKSENSQNFNEVIIVSTKMNRFKNTSDNIIRPTDSLLVIIEKNDKIKLSDVFLAIQLYAKPICTKILEEDKENKGIPLYQVLFKFNSVQQAIKTLAQAHNNDIKGYSLNVAFTATGF